MYTDIFNIFLAFLEGFALIVSPCILPILPIILAGSLVGDRRRPFGIIIGFIVAFTLFTLFARGLVQALQINPEFLRYASLILLCLLGIIMMSTYLSSRFTLLTQGLMRVGNHQQNKTGFIGGFVFGLLIGIIWTPCAGPILAAIVVQIVLQKTNFLSVLVIIAFAIGVAVPMFLITVFGRSFMQHFSFFRTHTNAVRQILGAIIICSVVILYFNPTLLIADETVPASEVEGKQLLKGIAQPFPAPAIAGIDAWINSPPLQISNLKGKVVLIDFWTYSCINCIRTLPYLKSWYEKYRDQGFMIIGVHSPEFAFEHELANVQSAVKNYGITYPVALDNRFVTWQNYFNRYWPAHYLIDKNGNVVYIHFGEGEYDVTENNIRYLLGLNKMESTKEKTERNYLQTPETYLGYARINNFSSLESLNRNDAQQYTFPPSLSMNHWALQGTWLVAAEKIISQAPNAKLKLHFNAKYVFAVMGSPTKPVEVKVQFHAENSSAASQPKLIKVDRHQLYELLKFDEVKTGYLELDALDPGLEIYTFTFG